jgi:hypothetical protein
MPVVEGPLKKKSSRPPNREAALFFFLADVDAVAGFHGGREDVCPGAHTYRRTDKRSTGHSLVTDNNSNS